MHLNAKFVREASEIEECKLAITSNECWPASLCSKEQIKGDSGGNIGGVKCRPHRG